MPDWAFTAWIRANGAEFNTKFAGMKAAVSGFGSAAKAAFERAIPGGRALSGVFRSMAGQVALGNLVSRGIGMVGRELRDIVTSVPDFAERAEQIGRTAMIIGTSAESWQRWGYAAKMTDTSAESLQNAMQKLNKNMADLTVGKGTLMDLVKFGPSGLARMIRGTHSTTEAMLLMADSFQKVKDPQLRARMAVAAFGKAGQDLIPMLALGRAELLKLMKDTDVYGSNITPEAIAASQHFADNLKKLRGMFGSVKDSALSALVQAINPYVDKVTEWVRTHEDLIKQKIPEYIDKIVTAAKNLWDFMTRVHDTWKKLDDLANGHLARDILLVVAAWKGVRLAIDLATAAATAFKLVSGGGAAGAAAGVAAPAWQMGTGFASSALRTAAMAVPLAGAAITAGTSLLPAFQDPGSFLHAANTGEHVQGGGMFTNLFSKAYGLGAKIHGGKENQGVAPNASTPGAPAQSVDVNVLLRWLSDNKGVSATVAPAITGASGSQYGVATP